MLQNANYAAFSEKIEGQKKEQKIMLGPSKILRYMQM